MNQIQDANLATKAKFPVSPEEIYELFIDWEKKTGFIAKLHAFVRDSIRLTIGPGMLIGATKLGFCIQIFIQTEQLDEHSFPVPSSPPDGQQEAIKSGQAQALGGATNPHFPVSPEESYTLFIDWAKATGFAAQLQVFVSDAIRLTIRPFMLIGGTKWGFSIKIFIQTDQLDEGSFPVPPESAPADGRESRSK